MFVRVGLWLRGWEMCREDMYGVGKMGLLNLRLGFWIERFGSRKKDMK